MASIDDNIRKVPPQNLEAEAGVLGSILIDNESLNKILGFLRAEDFYRESHRMIFRAMLELHEEQLPTELIVLSERLREKGNLESVGGSAYLASMADNTPSSAQIRHYAVIVREKARLRQIIKTCTDAANRAFGQEDGAGELASAASAELLKEASNTVVGFRPLSELTKSNIQRIEEAFERKQALSGIYTGLTLFERQYGCIRIGNLVVVGGRTSDGKTALSIHMAKAAASKGHRVAFVSAESGCDEITLRLFSQVSKIENIRLQNATLTDDSEILKLCAARSVLDELPFSILDNVRDWEVIKSLLRGLKARHDDLSVIVLDYAQLLSVRNASENKRYLEVAKISGDAKGLARELGVAFVLLSQLSRDPEKQGKRRPVNSDLRESGSLEQDADVIFLLYRNDEMDRESRIELICSKNRDGRTGTIPMRFDKKTVSFSEWD